MRNLRKGTVRTAAVLLLIVGWTAASSGAGKKPPAQGTAAPQIAYTDMGKVYICNEDGSNKVAVYQNRDAYLRRPRIVLRPDLDGGEIYFVEWYPGSTSSAIRRTSFDVVNGVVGGIGTETVLDFPIESLTLALSPNGEKLVFLVGTDSGSNALYELRICSQPPCSFENDAALLFEPAPDRWIGPIGGYSANGLAYYFVERSLTSGEFGFEIRRVDLSLGSTYGAVETVLAGNGIGEELETNRTESAGLESRLVFDVNKTVYVFDTAAPNQDPTPIVEGHTATWSPDDTRILFLEYWGTQRNCCSGPAGVLDLTATPPTESRLIKFATQPDWARTPQ